MSIKIGFCAGPDKLPMLQSAGIPYMEMSVGAVCAWTEEELGENLARIRDAGIRMETCNGLIGGFSLYEDTDFVRTNAYFDRVLPRLAAAGMKILVFGSGGYRRVPEGYDRDAARARIIAFLRLLSKRIEPYGFTVVVEPLNFNECNILNTSAEAADYVRECGRPNIRLLVDYYHFLLVGERLSAIADYRGILVHTHIAHPVGRRTPAPLDGVDYRGFFDALRAIGYDGLVVAEPRLGDDPAREMLEFADAMARARG